MPPILELSSGYYCFEQFVFFHKQKVEDTVQEILEEARVGEDVTLSPMAELIWEPTGQEQRRFQETMGAVWKWPL